MENPIKMDDLGVPLFLETPIYIYTYSSWETFFFQSLVFFSLETKNPILGICIPNPS